MCFYKICTYCISYTYSCTCDCSLSCGDIWLYEFCFVSFHFDLFVWVMFVTFHFVLCVWVCFVTFGLQGVVLKLLVADQAQYDMTDMNESHRRLPHSVSHRKNIQFHILHDRNRIMLLRNRFTKQCKIMLNRFF